MNAKFHNTVQKKDDVTYLKLMGVIDEDNSLADTTAKISKGTCAIDLAEVERINSCGVRDWVNWLGEIEHRGVTPVFMNCSPAIVAQINLVNNFTGGGAVKSFYAPYFCPDHGEKLFLIEAGEMGPPPHHAPTCRCDECDAIMDFDDMEDSYFAFMANPQKLSDAKRIDKVVKEMAPEEERSKIRSRVNASQTGVGSHGSLPSVPSLPSISKVSPLSHGGFVPKGGTQPGTSAGGAPSAAQRSEAGAQAVSTAGAMPRPGSGNLVFVLVGVLVVAAGVLAALILGRG